MPCPWDGQSLKTKACQFTTDHVTWQSHLMTKQNKQLMCVRNGVWLLRHFGMPLRENCFSFHFLFDPLINVVIVSLSFFCALLNTFLIPLYIWVHSCFLSGSHYLSSNVISHSFLCFFSPLHSCSTSLITFCSPVLICPHLVLLFKNMELLEPWPKTEPRKYSHALSPEGISAFIHFTTVKSI